MVLERDESRRAESRGHREKLKGMAAALCIGGAPSVSLGFGLCLLKMIGSDVPADAAPEARADLFLWEAMICFASGA